MDNNQIRILNILIEISQNEHISQRDLAKKLSMSLGLVNSYLKGLSKKGHIIISDSSSYQFNYILSPSGSAERIRLSYEYFQHAFHYYKIVRNKISSVYHEFIDQKAYSIVFYGAGELAKVAFELMQQTNIKLVGVIDPYRCGKQFKGMEVLHPDNFISTNCDMVFILELIDGQNVEQISNSINIGQSMCATIK